MATINTDWTNEPVLYYLVQMNGVYVQVDGSDRITPEVDPNDSTLKRLSYDISTSLAPGDYSVIVTAHNGWEGTDSDPFSITKPVPLSQPIVSLDLN